MNYAKTIGFLAIVYIGLAMGTLPHCSADIVSNKARFRVRAGLLGTANEEGSISLRFNAAQWKKDQVGFRLLRRQQLKDDTWSEWYSVGPRIIAPDLTPARLAGMKLDTVQKEMPRWVKAGNPTTTDALVAKLSEAPKEYPGVLMIGFMNFQWAQALGHGYVDTTTKPNTLYEYAVAQIRKTPKGIIQDKPCATARLSSRHGDIECPAIERISATYSRSKRAGIRIVWKTKPEKQKGTRQVVSWAILSGDPASPLKKVANRVPFSRDKDVHDYATSTSGDVTGKSIKIGIAPVDSFGTVGQIQATVVAAPRLAKVDRPESVTVSVKENAPPVVRWKHNTRIPFKGYRIRFFLQKKNSGLADEIKLEQKELIPAGRRYWVDTRDLSQYEGRTVQYQIVVVSGDYRSDIGGPLSRSQQIPFSDMSAEAKEKGLRKWVSPTKKYSASLIEMSKTEMLLLFYDAKGKLESGVSIPCDAGRHHTRVLVGDYGDALVLVNTSPLAKVSHLISSRLMYVTRKGKIRDIGVEGGGGVDNDSGAERANKKRVTSKDIRPYFFPKYPGYVFCGQRDDGLFVLCRYSPLGEVLWKKQFKKHERPRPWGHALMPNTDFSIIVGDKISDYDREGKATPHPKSQ